MDVPERESAFEASRPQQRRNNNFEDTTEWRARMIFSTQTLGAPKARASATRKTSQEKRFLAKVTQQILPTQVDNRTRLAASARMRKCFRYASNTFLLGVLIHVLFSGNSIANQACTLVEIIGNALSPHQRTVIQFFDKYGWYGWGTLAEERSAELKALLKDLSPHDRLALGRTLWGSSNKVDAYTAPLFFDLFFTHRRVAIDKPYLYLIPGLEHGEIIVLLQKMAAYYAHTALKSIRVSDLNLSLAQRRSLANTILHGTDSTEVVVNYFEQFGLAASDLQPYIEEWVKRDPLEFWASAQRGPTDPKLPYAPRSRHLVRSAFLLAADKILTDTGSTRERAK